jgi:hypothetical protein
MLFGGRISSRAPTFGGFEEVGCGKCMRIVFDESASGRRSQVVVTLAPEGRGIRRAYFTDLGGNGGSPEGSGSDSILLYEAELNPAEEETLVHEIDKQPW